MNDMKLFVWDNFCPDYTSGLAFAIAESLEEAKDLVVKEYGWEPYKWGILTVYDNLNQHIARAVSGGG